MFVIKILSFKINKKNHFFLFFFYFFLFSSSKNSCFWCNANYLSMLSKSFPLRICLSDRKVMSEGKSTTPVLVHSSIASSTFQYTLLSI